MLVFGGVKSVPFGPQKTHVIMKVLSPQGCNGVALKNEGNVGGHGI